MFKTMHHPSKRHRARELLVDAIRQLHPARQIERGVAFIMYLAAIVSLVVALTLFALEHWTALWVLGASGPLWGLVLLGNLMVSLIEKQEADQ